MAPIVGLEVDLDELYATSDLQYSCRDVLLR